jgi:hypothetical protein
VVVNVFKLVDVTCEEIGNLDVSHRCTENARAALNERSGSFSDRDVPCFCMTWRNLITTLDTGRTRTWRLPRFSALYIAWSDREHGEGGMR